MHSEFANLYKPVSFGHNIEIIEFRWSAVEKILSEIDFGLMLDLVRLVYGITSCPQESIDIIVNEIKKHDPSFPSYGIDKEVKTIASAILAIIAIEGNVNSGKLCLPILTSEFSKYRKHDFNIDLLGMAETCVNKNSYAIRKRKDIAKVSPVSYKNSFKDAIGELEGVVDADHITKVLNSFAAIVQKISSSQSLAFSEQVSQLNNMLKIQDEELQILWWINSGFSNIFNDDICNIDKQLAPIILGIEASQISENFCEPPSLNSIFGRLNLKKNEMVDVTGCISKAGSELKQLISGNVSYCPLILPVHFGIKMAIDVEGSDAWIPMWKKITKIENPDKTSEVDLAVQIFRERKIISFLEQE